MTICFKSSFCLLNLLNIAWKITEICYPILNVKRMHFMYGDCVASIKRAVKEKDRKRRKDWLCDGGYLVNNTKRWNKNVKYCDEKNTNDRPVVGFISLAHLLVFRDVVDAVPDEADTHCDLQQQAHADHGERRIKVGMLTIRLENVAHLIRVGGQQRQVHHTLGESLLVLINVYVGSGELYGRWDGPARWEFRSVSVEINHRLIVSIKVDLHSGDRRPPCCISRVVREIISLGGQTGARKHGRNCIRIAGCSQRPRRLVVDFVQMYYLVIASLHLVVHVAGKLNQTLVEEYHLWKKYKYFPLRFTHIISYERILF